MLINISLYNNGIVILHVPEKSDPWVRSRNIFSTSIEDCRHKSYQLWSCTYVAMI